jgi:uncharacterized membrane protein YebE (DUF533 family)
LADNRHSNKTHQQNKKRDQKTPNKQQQEARKAKNDHLKTELRAMIALV